MFKKVFACLLGILLLAGCNLPNRPINTTPTPDSVGTQVSQLLTRQPTLTVVQPTPAPSMTNAPSATPPQATETTAPPPTQSGPTPTSPTGDPKTSLGQPTWRDTLDTGKGWYLYETDQTKVAVDNGALALTGINANGWLGWSLTFTKPSQNFYIEGVFQPQTCSGADLYGLVFRAPDTDSGYFFGVTCDGKYNFHARNFKDDSDIVIAEMTPNSAIQPGAGTTNRLGVLANGDKITLYANGTSLKEFTDTTFKDKGYFGAFIAANNTAGFTTRMDEISLWQLP